jgi:hypothetical protein
MSELESSNTDAHERGTQTYTRGTHLIDMREQYVQRAQAYWDSLTKTCLAEHTRRATSNTPFTPHTRTDTHTHTCCVDTDRASAQRPRQTCMFPRERATRNKLVLSGPKQQMLDMFCDHPRTASLYRWWNRGSEKGEGTNNGWRDACQLALVCLTWNKP